ncbi:MAG TPA: hypothetical protein VHL08_00800 [Dongiaceae bacterium]|jgi:hypothetical protein|nr:hypothetical protein [Dongiaceae bacterium]
MAATDKGKLARARRRGARDSRSSIAILIDSELWYWVKLAALKRGINSSALVEAVLMMLRDQEDDLKGALNVYIEDIFREKSAAPKRRRPSSPKD